MVTGLHKSVDYSLTLPKTMEVDPAVDGQTICYNAALRLTHEFMNLADPPATAAEFKGAAAQLNQLFENMDIKPPPPSELYAMMLQQAPFTWDLLSTLCREVPIDVCRPSRDVPSFKLTTGHAQLDPHIPSALRQCCITGEQCTEGFVAGHPTHATRIVSLEACLDVLIDEVPLALSGCLFSSPQHPAARGALHAAALTSLIKGAAETSGPTDPDCLIGSFVDVNTESEDGGVLVETMLVTEFDKARGNIFGYWLYDLSTVSKDKVDPEDSMDTDADAEREQLLLSDHFDTVSITTLAAHCQGPRAREFESVVGSIVGAWSSKHTMLFHGVHRVRTFVEMCGICNDLGYSNAGLQLWPKLQRRVNLILPSGIDGSLQRAADLCDEMWKGTEVSRMLFSTTGVCDCCGMTRTLSHTLNEEWYIGSSCAAKISALSREIEAARAM